MDFFDIRTLKKDKNQGNLFNFFTPTFLMSNSFEQEVLVVGKESQMRPDLICNELYQRVDQIDFLMSLNDIDNPLNIMENDLIYFTSYSAIDSFRIKAAEIAETRDLLLNANKSTKKDDSRQKYVEEKFNLPPTFLPAPKPPIRIEGDDFIIGG